MTVFSFETGDGNLQKRPINPPTPPTPTKKMNDKMFSYFSEKYAQGTHKYAQLCEVSAAHLNGAGLKHPQFKPLSAAVEREIVALRASVLARDLNTSAVAMEMAIADLADLLDHKETFAYVPRDE